MKVHLLILISLWLMYFQIDRKMAMDGYGYFEDRMRWKKMVADKSMLDDITFSDVEIVCGDVSIRGHKVILSRFEYFKKCFSGKWQETSTNRLEIKDLDAGAVREALTFIYTGRGIYITYPPPLRG